MKTEYVCGKCGARFSSERDCLACEERHNDKATITKMRYRLNGSFPSEIYIDFGEECEHKGYKYMLDPYLDCFVNHANCKGFADD